MRRDLAVIMARGLSTRMGRDKGLVRLTPGGAPLVRIIADLYHEAGIPVLVVALAEQEEEYRRALGLEDVDGIVTAGPGGDTARTLALAAGAEEFENTTHVWAHPVDLPGVAAGTIAQLADWSELNPSEAVRPTWQDRPGHPVVFPSIVVTSLESLPGWHDKPLREVWPAGENAGPVSLAVADPGVVRDLDCPADLPPGAPPSPDRGTS